MLSSKFDVALHKIGDHKLLYEILYINMKNDMMAYETAVSFQLHGSKALVKVPY